MYKDIKIIHIIVTKKVKKVYNDSLIKTYSM